MDETKLDLLIAALWAGAPPNVYAILDGARDPRVHAAVEDSGLPHQCLFAGKLRPELSRAAPWLVQLKQDAPLVRNVLLNGWGDAWGIFLASQASIEHLRVHFRRFLKVDDARGNRMYFRYYDPRVLRVYLPTCNDLEIDTVFGPVQSYLFEGATPDQLLDYQRIAGKLELRTRDWARGDAS